MVALDLMADGLELVVLPRLELLVLQSLDGGLARLDVEFHALDLHLDIARLLQRRIHAGLITGELEFRALLE